ncbi:DUF1161 domain-containing protein [Xenorhabdus mauleonii]
MVKKILLTGALFFVLSPLAAQASQKTTCESLKEEIAQKIIKNGVAETDFKLEIVPKDQAISDGKVVGHCGLGKQKIVYTRFTHSNTANTQASTLADGKKNQE